MALYAVEAVDDAYRATSAFLRPVDRSRWLKLALVGLFVGTPGVGANSVQFSVPADGTTPSNGDFSTVPTEVWIAVAVAVGLAVLVVLAVLFVGSVMEFVLVESLRQEEVRVRAYWSRHLRRGTRLFGFRLAVGLFVLATVLVLFGLLVVPLALGVGAVSALVLVVVLIPVFVVLAVVTGLVDGFTTMFVVPVMMVEECGVLAGWRRFWPTLAGAWTQYLAYAVVSFVLALVGGLLVAAVTAVLAIVLLIPIGVLAGVGVLLFLLTPALGIPALVIVGVLFVAGLVAVAALVQVPVITYLRYFALLVLGETNAAFDLIPDQREAARR